MKKDKKLTVSELYQIIKALEQRIKELELKDFHKSWRESVDYKKSKEGK